MTSQLGNILTRLQGLKNVSGRRKVMQDTPFNMPQEEADVAGTAQEALPMNQNYALMNQPEQDMGGELTAQSYDVRANAVDKAPPEDEGTFTKIGKWLGNQFKAERTPWPETSSQAQWPQLPATPPRVGETQQPMDQTPVNPVPETKDGGFFTNFSNALKSSFSPSLSPEAQIVKPPEGGDMLQYLTQNVGTATPEFAQAFPDVAQNNPVIQEQLKKQQEAQLAGAVSQENLTHNIDKAMQEPWEHMAYGSTQEVANSPALQAEFKKIVGYDFEPQLQEQVFRMESAMKVVEDRIKGLNAQLDPVADEIAARIQNNQTTEQDQYLMGLALLMPLLVGGFFGKEAGVNALSGGMAGLAKGLTDKKNQLRDDEMALSKINNMQIGNQETLANLQLKRGLLEPELRKNLPDDPRAHLVGMNEIEWVDPETGKKMGGVEILPGFVARSEKVATQKGIDRMEKAAQDLGELKTYVDNVNEVSANIAEILPQLKDDKFVWKTVRSSIANADPSLLNQVGDTVTVNGQKMNAGIALQQQLGLLAEIHAQAQKLGQLDKAAQVHWNKLVQNPQTSYASPHEALNSIIGVQKLANSTLVNSAYNQGFYPEFVIQETQKKTNPMFQKLNAREADKRGDALIKKASKHEVPYAK